MRKLIILVVIFAILFGTFVYYFSFKNSKSIIYPNEITTTKRITPNLSPWKLYKNNTFGYTVEIPMNWIIDEHKGVFINQPGEVVFYSPDNRERTPGSLYVAIFAANINDTPGNISFHTITEYQHWLKLPIATNTRQNLYKENNAFAGSLEGIEYVTQALPGDPTEGYSNLNTWFQKGNLNYFLQRNGYDKDKPDEYTNVYTHIIKTFKPVN
ncbi:MAG TPA: hypothetical protein VLG12_03075 [Candidatus Saccharimonadales bacterium]|nr:hypothetical protein [Candidatus Saccharimonadales bacterium]